LVSDYPNFDLKIYKDWTTNKNNIRTGIVSRLEKISTDEEFFIEPYYPQPKLYVFGGGHVGAKVGKLAKNVDFRVVILDDRPTFACKQRHPFADEFYSGELDHIFSEVETFIDAHSYILAATRGHKHDEDVVRWAVKTPAFFIGMLGSERKKQILWKRLLKSGNVENIDLQRISSPVGLNIGADNPEEIAISILAEMIKVRRGVKREWKTKMDGN